MIPYHCTETSQYIGQAQFHFSPLEARAITDDNYFCLLCCNFLVSAPFVLLKLRKVFANVCYDNLNRNGCTFAPHFCLSALLRDRKNNMDRDET